MNRVWKWILIFLAALLVVFLISLAIFGGFRMGRMGYVGGFGRGIGMMGWFGFAPFAGLLGLVVLGFAIYGLVALVSGRRHITPPPMPKTCPNCGRVVEQSWVNCPYCGHDLRGQTPPPAAPTETKSEENKPQ
jgi:hypothetical protein